MKHVLFASALLFAAACGSKSKPADTAGGGGATGGGGEPAADVHFDDLDHDAQLAYMKDVVKPKMAALFAEFDPEEFSDVGCKTCHGSGVDQGDFHMPSAELPALSMEEIMNPDADHQAITDFMKQKVVPVMAELLGEAPFDPATGQGFGCGSCHPFQE